MPRFPDVEPVPNDYSLEWHLASGRTVAGEISLRSNEPPALTIYDIEPSDFGDSPSFPLYHEVDSLHGTLRNGLDVVATDVGLHLWPGRAFGGSRFALVGRGAGSVAEGRYHHVEFQVTSSDLFFGTPPLLNVSIPERSGPRLSGSFSASGNSDSSHNWQSDELTVECSYDFSVSGERGYGFGLRFAPVCRLSSADALIIDEGVARWVTPFQRVTSFAVKMPQKRAWLRAETGLPEASISSHDTV